MGCCKPDVTSYHSLNRVDIKSQSDYEVPLIDINLDYTTCVESHDCCTIRYDTTSEFSVDSLKAFRLQCPQNVVYSEVLYHYCCASCTAFVHCIIHFLCVFCTYIFSVWLFFFCFFCTYCISHLNVMSTTLLLYDCYRMFMHKFSRSSKPLYIHLAVSSGTEDFSLPVEFSVTLIISGTVCIQGVTLSHDIVKCSCNLLFATASL